ncbi:MAG: 50S ribosomal protein L10 [Deltaproteobacteria bacterium]|nr:50S ribosomal protein L10 [Deltaproteobacteria bacterium]
MKKGEKEEVVAELREKFQGAQAAILAEYRGLTVAQTGRLRRALEKEGAAYKVVKNTLARIAVDGTDFEVLKDQFRGPLSVVLAYKDAAAAAKVVDVFARENPAFIVKSGALGGKLFGAQDVEALSKLPSREQLLGQLVGVLQGPMRNFLGVLSGVPRSFVQVLHAIQEKKAA